MVRGKKHPVASDGKKVKARVDKDWFDIRMKAAGYTKFAQLARDIGIDRSMMHRSLSGDRPFTVDNVIALARVLNTTSDEIFKRIGYDIPKRGVPIVGIVRDDGRVSTVTHHKGRLFEMHEPPEGGQAILGEMSTVALAGYDKATFVYVPGSANGVPTTGQLVIAEIEGQLTPYLGKLVKGNSRGKAALEVFGSGQKIELNQGLQRISPVVGIYFA